MIKKIIISACLLLSLVSFAQEGTSSPYSFYGIGDIRFKGALENRSMGGLAVEQDSIHINLQNPASYANLKLTTFTLGGTYGTTTLKNNTESANARRTVLDYLAVGLPLGKFGLGFGLIPYSSVGYKIESISESPAENNKRFNGTGGLNKAFLGVGYKIAPNFNIGADVNYNFGKIETNSLEFITGVPVGTRELNSADLSGVNFNFGMMYQTKLYKKINLFSSLTYSLESSLTSKNNRNIATVIYNSNFDVSVVDALADVKTEATITMPSKITLSGGIGESKKWLVGGNISYGKTSGQANDYNEEVNVGYGKYGSVSLGGYFIPNYNSFTSYTKRIVYRAGIRYEKTGLVIDSESINDMGVTFGLGLPITGTFSNVNFGFELGKRGTTKANLVQENYANLSVSFSLNDKWFEKRKFN
jgi:long-subunit fatty acid transport protein